MDLNKEMIKGNIESVILSQLKEEDLYGYEICKRIRDISEHTFEIKEGTLYIVLKRLEKNGMVRSYWNESTESGGGRRRYYQINEEGIRYLTERKQQWDFLKNMMDLFYKGV
ncbi:transcriptional regulator, PadR-like family [Paenibacillus curdlanolyticus YK9]|uniref:Transcriptional regulator, PadR-like family n=1 Tax=Paenibacillus curdlanolyticus YK9 TaxID=717606 RepID=E0ID30_9BACL|nr:PadR family transcriptional regulator [Paenibacillus curdlanolyticus]EFM09485.1 transcriptional regulator, PadR-like family [Paenibacillus curdlanolyticus YK9]